MFKRRKFASLQAGRGLAALMVVVCHVGSFYGPGPNLWQNASIFRWLSLGKYGIDFFFILSGIVILLAHWNDLDHPARATTFLWKRFRRIYPIYWIFLIPTVFKQFSVDTGHTADQRNPYVVLSSFALIHVRSLAFSLAPSWTLFHEVIFYLIFTTLLISKKIGMLLFSLWFGASLFYFSPSSVSVEPSSYLEMLFSPLHLLFAFGLLVGWFLHHQRGPSHLWVLSLGMAIFTGGLLFNAFSQIENPWIRVTGGAGLALAVLAGAEREYLRRLRVPRTLIFLGDASYSIYLAHFMVISAVARKGFALDQRLHLPTVFWMTVMFVASVSFGILAHLFIERPLLMWLSGNPKPSKSLIGGTEKAPDFG